MAETTRSRPSGALRLAFKLPIHLYRLRLGWLLGHRILLLAHRGRNSGRLRHTPLEVIRYDSSTRESVVVSAWGESSDWYRNLKASPAVEVRTANRRFVPDQRFLSPEETYAEMIEYERRHPRAARALSSWLGNPLDGTEQARRRFADSVRMVAFRPEHRSSRNMPDT